MDSSDNLVEVRGLKVHFPVRKGVFGLTVDHIRAVDGISFDIRRGETLALVGESGCGKSTTARVLVGLQKSTSGEIRVAAGAGRFSMVFQDPLGALNPRQTVRSMLSEVLAHSARAGGDPEALLKDVGLDASALDRYPHEFSGGQRQRLCIARAIASEPELLICDEAVSALDLSIRAQILGLLSELKRRHGLTILFITHDLGVVRHIADRVVVMNRGRIEECGECARVLGAPESEYTKYLLASVPVLPQGR